MLLDIVNLVGVAKTGAWMLSLQKLSRKRKLGAGSTHHRFIMRTRETSTYSLPEVKDLKAELEAWSRVKAKSLRC